VTWTPICAYDDLVPERGVAALLGRSQIAIFRLVDGSVVAVGHQDPFSRANVIARGIVGTRQDVPTVASPVHKQVFDLLTGRCLDDSEVRLSTWPVLVDDGIVHLGVG
jgi:nitrite reductase (NADH) small subunit